jgi:hypothetical protein
MKLEKSVCCPRKERVGERSYPWIRRWYVYAVYLKCGELADWLRHLELPNPPTLSPIKEIPTFSPVSNPSRPSHPTNKAQTKTKSSLGSPIPAMRYPLSLPSSTPKELSPIPPPNPPFHRSKRSKRHTAQMNATFRSQGLPSSLPNML